MVKRQQAQADKAYEIQTNVMQQQVIAEAVKVQQVEKEQQVKVQEAEILRREKELIATVLKQPRSNANVSRRWPKPSGSGRPWSKPKATPARSARKAKPKRKSSSRKVMPRRGQ